MIEKFGQRYGAAYYVDDGARKLVGNKNDTVEAFYKAYLHGRDSAYT